MKRLITRILEALVCLGILAIFFMGGVQAQPIFISALDPVAEITVVRHDDQSRAITGATVRFYSVRESNFSGPLIDFDETKLTDSSGQATFPLVSDGPPPDYYEVEVSNSQRQIMVSGSTFKPQVACTMVPETMRIFSSETTTRQTLTGAFQSVIAKTVRLNCPFSTQGPTVQEVVDTTTPPETDPVVEDTGDGVVDEVAVVEVEPDDPTEEPLPKQVGPTVTFAEGWRNYDEKRFSTAQAVLQGDVCVVSGLVTSGEVQTKQAHVATLSSDCRPSSRLVFNLNHHATTARVDVFPDGRIIWRSGFVRYPWLNLDGIAFAVGDGGSAGLKLGPAWKDYGQVHDTNSWRGPRIKREGSLCILSGLVARPTVSPALKSSADIVIAALPDHCRPRSGLIFKLHANSHNPTTRVDVMPTGEVLLRSGSGFRGWLSLSGIIFQGKNLGSDRRSKHGGSRPIPLENNWVNHHNKNYEVAGYNTAGKICSLTGLIKPGKGSKYGHVATLPDDCQPKQRLIFNVHANTFDNTTRVDIFPAGDKTYPAGAIVWRTGGKGGWISLAGINFATTAAKTAN